MYLLIFLPIILSVAYSVYIMLWLSKQPNGNAKMAEISTAIQEGSSAFLNRQYKSVAAVAAVLLAGIFWEYRQPQDF
jgi:K(+)-stimulated pyrophosphate-energized sodium pump